MKNIYEHCPLAIGIRFFFGVDNIDGDIDVDIDIIDIDVDIQI